MVQTYTNKYGDTIRREVENFDFRCTIMNARIQKVGDFVVHRLWVEDKDGGKAVTIWNNARGYNPELIKAGHSIHIKGYVNAQSYLNEHGQPVIYKEYKAQEMLP